MHTRNVRKTNSKLVTVPVNSFVLKSSVKKKLLKMAFFMCGLGDVVIHRMRLASTPISQPLQTNFVPKLLFTPTLLSSLDRWREEKPRQMCTLRRFYSMSWKL